MKRILCGIALWACGFAAIAVDPATVRKQIEMSMLVTGTIDLMPDGTVDGYALDQSKALPQGVVNVIDQSVPRWHFEPLLIDGKPVKARAKMSVRIVAKPQDDGNYAVSIRSAGFGEESGEQGENISARKLAPPAYPVEAFQYGVTGTVYLVLRVGRNGAVEDVVAEQVNLTTFSSEQQIKRGRDLLSRASLRQARKWSFNPPTKGPAADDPFWSIRVPVEFQYEDQKGTGYGQWQAYLPGPRQQPTWIDDRDASGNPDAMVAGGVYLLGKGPRLLTPLSAR